MKYASFVGIIWFLFVFVLVQNLYIAKEYELSALWGALGSFFSIPYSIISLFKLLKNEKENIYNIENVEVLKSLNSDGIISNDEFIALKKKLLKI